MTDLKDKAINIKGSQYVLVKDRIVAFNTDYPNGSIVTELVSYQNNQAIVKATVIPDTDKPTRFFTGHSQAVDGQGMVNKTAALENAESSAVGRALAMLGIGVIDSVASFDEMAKAGAVEQGKPTDPEWIREPVNPETSQPSLKVDTCPVHHVDMFPKEGKYGTFYSHLDKDYGYCTGKWFKARS